MKNILSIVFVLLLGSSAYAQKSKIDSLLAKLDRTEDIKKLSPVMKELLALPQGDFILLKKGKQELANARLSDSPAKKQRALLITCAAAYHLHDNPEVLDASLQGIRVSRDLNDNRLLGYFLHNAGLANVYQRETHKAINFLLVAIRASAAASDTLAVLGHYSNLESAYVDLKMPDSALFFASLEMALVKKRNKTHPHDWDASRTAIGDLGEAFASAGRLDSALIYYRQGYALVKKNDQALLDFPYLINNLAKTYLNIGKLDSAAKYALESYGLASNNKVGEFTADAASILAKAYEGRDDKKALFYLKAQMEASNSINASEKSKQFQLVADKDIQHEVELKAEQERLYTLVRLYLVIVAAVVLLIIGIILWRNNQKQKQTNLLLSEQKDEIESQRDNLGQTLEELKHTQTQLIQSEKMASLGELTAGIAHEIQNPLNFVNNFSEVSIELLEEMAAELKLGQTEDAIDIGNDVRQNLEKIRHHGKRADFIVKGMLQHSRTSTGEKQPTNLNLLADEFFKLSYHGLRAKDKNFNAELVTHFDPDLPKINVVQQDIGRVLLNLFNNAFYAVNQRAKTAGADYKPEVSIATSSENRKIIIKVKDNGIGIPDAVKEKIMQPFFTTKPTGEGTGLGLSLSYDIVVKGHGGSINVETKEGEFTEFTVMLPLS